MLRLTPQPFTKLPAHPDLEDASKSQAARPELADFLHSVLTEAQTFITKTIPQTFIPERRLRASLPSTAKVQLLSRTITTVPDDAQNNNHTKRGDYWVCRRSTHANAAQRGTATWAEFESGLRENHSENEMAYTPSVAAVAHLLQWPVLGEVKGGWTDVDMHVNMITHTFTPGALISPRTFISLVISAYEPRPHGTESSQRGFFTVQTPLSFKDSVPAGLSDKIRSAVPRNTIFAHYASVEHVVLLNTLSPANTTDERQRIEWTMATTSDAGGLIPQWMQRSWTMGGVPKAVVADVGLFLGWIDRRRQG